MPRNKDSLAQPLKKEVVRNRPKQK